MTGFSCVAMGTSYWMKLLGYTVGPVIILFMIVLPCSLARVVLSSQQRSAEPWKSRYESAKATMMNNICYFLFLIYPTVSLTALKGLHCRDFGPPHGSLLMSGTLMFVCESLLIAADHRSLHQMCKCCARTDARIQTRFSSPGPWLLFLCILSVSLSSCTQSCATMVFRAWHNTKLSKGVYAY